MPIFNNKILKQICNLFWENNPSPPPMSLAQRINLYTEKFNSYIIYVVTDYGFRILRSQDIRQDDANLKANIKQLNIPYFYTPLWDNMAPLIYEC